MCAEAMNTQAFKQGLVVVFIRIIGGQKLAAVENRIGSGMEA